ASPMRTSTSRWRSRRPGAAATRADTGRPTSRSTPRGPGRRSRAAISARPGAEAGSAPPRRRRYRADGRRDLFEVLDLLDRVVAGELDLVLDLFDLVEVLHVRLGELGADLLGVEQIDLTRALVARGAAGGSRAQRSLKVAELLEDVLGVGDRRVLVVEVVRLRRRERGGRRFLGRSRPGDREVDRD